MGTSRFFDYPRINVKELIKDYDGIYVTRKATIQLRHTRHSAKDMVADLGSWDVESICVFKPEVIVPIKEDEFDKAKVNDYSKQNTDRDEYFGREPEYDTNKKERQIQHDFNLYGNKNIDADMSKPFNGQHPAILAQGDGRLKDTIKARSFNGTIKSGIKEDKTLFHGTRADFNHFDLAYLSSG